MIFYSSTCSMNQMQTAVKPCKAEIQKGKNESSVRKQYTVVKSGRTYILCSSLGRVNSHLILCSSLGRVNSHLKTE